MRYTKQDPRVGERVELHPATNAWAQGDRYGEILAVSTTARGFLDPRDPRNGRVYRVRMNRSGRVVRVAEGNIYQLFPR